jgi:hypothetical protein
MQGGQSLDDLAEGTWKLIFLGQGSHFDGWLYDASLPVEITLNANEGNLIPEPANAHFPIAVASYSTRSEWPSLYQNPWRPYDVTVGALSAFSSPGPTRDGREKPDLAAPGEHILAALAATSSPLPSAYYTATDGVHRAWAGTSMAAPHVTGAAALLFEMDPALRSSQIKGYLRFTARRDVHTGESGWVNQWHPSWGAGKLDVLATMQMAPVQNDDFTRPTAFHLKANFPNPFNPRTHIAYTVKHRTFVQLNVYDVQGRLVRTLVHDLQSPGAYQLEWDGCDEAGWPVSSGVYLCKLQSRESCQTIKMTLLR